MAPASTTPLGGPAFSALICASLEACRPIAPLPLSPPTGASDSYLIAKPKPQCCARRCQASSIRPQAILSDNSCGPWLAGSTCCSPVRQEDRLSTPADGGACCAGRGAPGLGGAPQEVLVNVFGRINGCMSRKSARSACRRWHEAHGLSVHARAPDLPRHRQDPAALPLCHQPGPEAPHARRAPPGPPARPRGPHKPPEAQPRQLQASSAAIVETLLEPSTTLSHAPSVPLPGLLSPSSLKHAPREKPCGSQQPPTPRSSGF